jgi:hypothetical protein
MTPQVNLNGTDRVTQTIPAPAPTSLAARSETSAAQELTAKDRQGLAMSWVFSLLGMFLLLGGLALGAAVVFNVGFVGWLISMALMGLVIVAVIAAVNYYVLRPGH